MLSAPVALMLLKFESDQYDRRWRESEKADSSDITNIEEDIEWMETNENEWIDSHPNWVEA